jgi:hypothetical protein
MTGPFRRSPAFRLACYVALIPVWVLVALVSIDSLGKYTTVGDVALVALIMLFALWAWWYGEDRDRRANLSERRRGPSGDSG